MHVLVVPSWYPTTEAPLDGIYFSEQTHFLHNHGMQVGVVFPEHQSLRRLSCEALRNKHFQTKWEDDEGIPTLRHLGWNVWWRFPPGFRLRIRTAVRLARRYIQRYGRPDVVHAHSARWAGAAAARIKNEFSIPYVLTEHYSGLQRGDVFPWRWSLVERGFRHADAIAAVSSPLKNVIVDQDLAASSEIDVCPNPVHASLFTRPEDGRLSPPPFRFVTVARLRPQKNLGGLLAAFASAFAGSSDVSLTIVGSGSERNALERTAQHLGVAERVSFLGKLDREGVRDALQNAHAFALSSHHETFGVVVVEAMATGLPVVATRCGGPEDIVTEDTGLLVPPTDTEALARGLRTIREQWPTFDEAGIRKQALARYGPEPFVRRTRSLYRRAGVAIE